MANKLTPEQAKELGRAGGLASAAKRAERAAQRKEILAQARFQEAADDMAAIIIEAAKGHKDFKALSPKDRAQFAVKALEYGVGRPRGVEPAAPEEVEEQQGLAFQVADEDRTLAALAGEPDDGA